MSNETPLPKLPALSDPESVESQIQGSDLASDAPAQSQTDEEIVALVEERFRAAVDARVMRDPKIFLPLAFFIGEQHMGWSMHQERLVDVRNLNESWRSFGTRNKIRGKVLKLLARALESQPEPSFRPMMLSSEMDQAAAAEARAIRAHLCRVHDEDQQMSEEVLWAIVTGMSFRKYYWDPTAEADIPDYDAQGNLIGTTRGRVGEIARDTIPITDLYPDPEALIVKGRITRCAWLIHSSVCSLDELRDRYGDAAMHLDGEIATGRQGYVEERMAAIVGEAQQNSEAIKNAVVAKEMWEQPSLRYPEGRLIVTAQSRVLRYDEAWPCTKRDSYPFVPRVWHAGLGTFYADGAVWDAIGAQRTYNLATSAMDEALKYPWGKWFVPRGAEVGPGPDSLFDPNELTMYNLPFKPEQIPAPPIAAIVLQAIQQSDRDLDDIFGVHDVSEGLAPSGITAGTALETLKEQDTSQLKVSLTNIDTSVHQDAEWEISLARDFYDSPRMMAVQDVSAAGMQPGQPSGAAQVMDFRALSAGGSCHIEVDSGSRAPLSAQARLTLITQLYQGQFFGPPGDPRSSMMALELMDEVRSDGLIERLMAMRKEMMAEQLAQAQQAQQAQAIQGQQAQAQQAQQAQNTGVLKVLQAHLDQSTAQAKAAQQHQQSAEMQAVQLHADLAQAAVLHAHDLEREAAQAQNAAAHVSVALTGSLDPAETSEAASAAGLQGDGGASAPAPPPPASQPSQPTQEAQNAGTDNQEAQAAQTL